MKIGIGITTTSSRFEIVENSLKILKSIINENKNKYEFIVSISCDGDLKNDELNTWNDLKLKFQNFIFNFKNNQSIAKNKNLSLEPLKENNCDFYLMLDDDCYINDIKGIEYYIEACKDFHFLHLHLTGWLRNRNDHDPRLIKKYDNFSVFKYNYPNGCFIIFDKMVLEKTNGWNDEFIGWGFEHGEFERRTGKLLKLNEIYLAIPEVYENNYIISYDAHFNNNCKKSYNELKNVQKLNKSKIEYERSSCYDHNKMVNDKSMSLFD